MEDIEDALLYLSKIGAVVLEGGFLVTYNGMEITRLILDNKIKYKAEDYRQLNEFYQQKIQQIHIVGEYANLMVKDYKAALQFVSDYFHMEYKRFIAKYFKGKRASDIERNITSQKYHRLFDTLSEKQLNIIQDNHSKYIVVAAGPGSGKTRVLVHKLAALLTLEEVKHEQLLMVTFSRAAATEFKLRLMQLTGNATYFVDIRTFHSYCFDLLGRPGNAQDTDTVVHDAAKMIRLGEVEQGRIAKAVVVIDEAQDMSKDDFALIEALIHQNEDMRVIAVGDDDQNIFAFRGSNSAYMKKLITDYGATQYDLLENYRSRQNIVRFSNDFVKKITGRLKNEENIAVQQEAGTVSLTKYRSRNMGIPLVRQVLTHKAIGSIGILTNTNEEAMRIVRLLRKQNRRARLIQSLDGFHLTDLAEVRCFLNEIRQNAITPLISDDVWKNTKSILKEQYAGSDCLGQGIITEQTKERLKELESEIARLEFDIEQERQRSFIEITTDKIIRFLKTALRPDYQDITARKVLVKYLIRDIIVYNDRIIINYYFTEPVRPHKRTESSAKETERAALAAAPLSASYCSNKCEISPPEKAPNRVPFRLEKSSPLPDPKVFRQLRCRHIS